MYPTVDKDEEGAWLSSRRIYLTVNRREEVFVLSNVDCSEFEVC